jgi:endonuclease-3
VIDVAALASFYGPLPPPPTDAFSVFVWSVLGMRTTDGRRDAALAALRKVPAMTPDSVRRLGRGRLESIVRLCGPFVDERLSALDTGVDVFRRRRDLESELAGPLRQAWLAAKDLPHLGEAGAARLLLFASPHAVPPVDQAICRVAVRLALTPPRRSVRRLARETRRALSTALPAEITARRRAVLYLAHHAQSTCVEGEPHCAVCPLAAGCAYAKATHRFIGP